VRSETSSRATSPLSAGSLEPQLAARANPANQLTASKSLRVMAELQGQASLGQPGLKADGLADVLQRARQVTAASGPRARVPGHLARAKPLFIRIFDRALLTPQLVGALRARAHTYTQC